VEAEFAQTGIGKLALGGSLRSFKDRFLNGIFTNVKQISSQSRNRNRPLQTASRKLFYITNCNYSHAIASTYYSTDLSHTQHKHTHTQANRISLIKEVFSFSRTNQKVIISFRDIIFTPKPSFVVLSFV